MMGQYGLLALVVVALVAGVTDALPPQKIIGGTRAAPGEFPYQVSLRINGGHFCGGSIIGSRHVVTAAHCVVNIVTRPYSNLVVVTGSVKHASGQTHTVKSVLYHSHYSSGSASSPNDIAVIVLHKDIPFNSYQNKVALPSAPTPTGVTATVVGWGYTRAFSLTMSPDLLKVSVTTLTAAECQKYLAQAAILYTHQICSFSAPGRGVCQGDSGGPLVYNGQLIGIVSYNIPCGKGYPDVYSSVYHYVDWLRQVTAMG